MYHLTNNGSDRGIRNIKVKQKVSGQFVSIQKAIDFAVVRPVFDTKIKTEVISFKSPGILLNLVHLNSYNLKLISD